ncbi:MAG: ammonium transporter [Proteobacteria bacterium]|nr:ammonium transporter [Pseudomonadota bacterium]
MEATTGKKTILPLIGLFVLATIGALSNAAPQSVVGDAINGADVAWMLTASALVLLMTPGLSFFYGGMVSKKNVISTLMQSFIAMGVISLLWIGCGFSLAFGDSIAGVVGNPMTFLMFSGVGTQTHPTLSATIPLLLFAIFQLKFAIITPALITGSFAERVRFSSYILFMCLFSLFIYSPLAHMTWHPDGLFRKWGVLDFAGGTVVHMSAGIAALAGALYLGRRKVHKAQASTVPANIPFVLLGTGMLWFGWFGFNAGSALAANETASLAFLTTNTACAAAMLTWLCTEMVAGKKPSALGACVGAVVGLVAITPAAGFVSIGASIFIGTAASFICNVAVQLRGKSNLDDTLDVFPCHGVGGIIGMLLTGVFAKDVGLIFGKTDTFMYHLLAMCIASAYTFVGSLILYKITDMIIPMRVTDEQEDIGLDITQHGETLSSKGVEQAIQDLQKAVA